MPAGLCKACLKCAVLPLVLLISLPTGVYCAESGLVPKDDRISDFQARRFIATLLSYKDTTLEESLTMMRRLKAESPSDPELDAELAGLLMRTKRHTEALPLLQTLHDKNPSDRTIGLMFVRALAYSGNLRQASEMARKLSEGVPDDPRLLLEWAETECLLGHVKQCFALSGRIEKLPSPDAETTLRLLNLHYFWGDFRLPEKLLRQNSLNIEESERTYRLGRTLTAMQRIEEAGDEFRKLIPGNKNATLGLAEVALTEKRPLKALEIIRPVLASEPENVTALLLELQGLKDAGRPEEARAVAGKISGLNPPEPDALLSLALYEFQLGLTDDAKKHLLAARPLTPALADKVRLLPGLDPDSRELSDTLIRENESPAALAAWAELFALSGRFTHAVSCLQKALAIDPEYFPAKMRLAEVWAANNEYAASLGILDALAVEFPQSFKIALTRARVLGWSKSYAASLQAYDNLSGENPDDPLPIRESGRVAFWDKNEGEALKRYARLLSDPADARLCTPLAGLVRETGNQSFREAEDKLRARFPNTPCSKETPSHDAPAALRIQTHAALEALAKAQGFNLHFARALQTYSRLADTEPGNLEARFDKAQVECTLGLCDLEEADYRRILDLDPLHSLAGKALKRNEILRRPALGVEYSYWTEDGHGDLSAIARHRADAVLEIPFAGRFNLRLGQSFYQESPRDEYGYEATGNTAALSGVLNEFFGFDASFTNKRYANASLKDANTGYVRLKFNLNDYARLDLFYERLDEIANGYAIRQGIQSDNPGILLTTWLTRNLDIQAEVRRKYYTDDNESDIQSLVLGWSVTDHPRIFRIILRGDHRDTKHQSQDVRVNGNLTDITHPYWSPDNYYAYSLILEWRHDLSEYFFCGAEKHFYDIRVSAGSDTDSNPAGRIEAEYRLDFSERWSFMLRGLLHRSQQWDAFGASMGLQYRF